MTMMITELYVALKEAGASEENATKAAEAVASYEERFNRIERDLTVLKWVTGTTAAGVWALVLTGTGVAIKYLIS